MDNKGFFISLLACILIFILLFAGVLNFNLSFYDQHNYDRYINRYYSSPYQEHALNLSEQLDYTNLFQSNGVSGGENNTFKGFINAYTLNSFDSYAQSHKNNAQITLNYTAWVYNFNSVQITKEGKNVSIFSDGINFATKNATGNFPRYTSFFTSNTTQYVFIKENGNFTYNYAQSGYIVDMKQLFSYVYALGSSVTYIRQTLILSTNYWIKSIFHGYGAYVLV